MDIETKQFKRVVLVTVAGRVDYPKALELADALNGLIEEGHHNIVIDLSGVNHMVSEGLRSMISGLKKCREKGGDIRIANPSERASFSLNLGGVDIVFDIYDDAISAVGSF